MTNTSRQYLESLDTRVLIEVALDLRSASAGHLDLIHVLADRLEAFDDLDLDALQGADAKIRELTASLAEALKARERVEALLAAEISANQLRIRHT